MANGINFCFGALTFQDGKVMVGINPNDFGFVGGLIIQNDLEGIGTVYNMEVGDDVPLTIPNETGS